MAQTRKPDDEPMRSSPYTGSSASSLRPVMAQSSSGAATSTPVISRSVGVSRVCQVSPFQRDRDPSSPPATRRSGERPWSTRRPSGQGMLARAEPSQWKSIRSAPLDPQT